ncbi:MAG: cell wall-binding repeat-containing protein [Mycetocola sp.]
MYAAARQLVWYTNPGSSMYQGGRFRVGEPRQIQYSPTTACGSSSVTIKNLATSALYFYTPYQPNANSLAAGWGASSDGCASYGNRNFSLYYNAWFGNPNSTTPLPTTRLGGSDRYETAVEISKDTFKTAGIPVVYIASGAGFADALSAAPAAAVQGGPLLLVAETIVPASTLSELKRLKPKKIVVVGGTGAVNSKVASALKAVAPVQRIAGADRFETSQLIAATVFPKVASAYLATGWDFADALSAGAAAGAAKTPVLLVDGKAKKADKATLNVLSAIGATKVTIAGGPGAITEGFASSVKAAGASVVRRSGSDRYATSVAINKAAFGSAATAYVAAGLAFPDALAGAAAAAKTGMPLYLSFATCLPKAVRESITAKNAKKLVVLGGTGALTDRVRMMYYC